MIEKFKKIIVIQARMGSTRLPGKVLRTIADRPIIQHVIDRMMKVPDVDTIYVATSNQAENQPLIRFLQNTSVKILEGDEANVLSRFLTIAKKEPSDYIIRVTADNPLTDSLMLKLLLEDHVMKKADYSFMVNLPKGISTEIINSNALLELEKLELEADDIEHVTLYLKKHPDKYKINYMEAPKEVSFPKLSLTVDTEYDLKIMSDIMKEYGVNVTLKEAIKYLNENRGRI